MRTLSQEEIDRVSGGVSSVESGEIGAGPRGYRIPGGGGKSNETTGLSKWWQTHPVNWGATEFSTTTSMS